MDRTTADLITFPRKLSFERSFEALPLLSEKAANSDVFCAGLVDGSMEISFTRAGDWLISDVHILVDNGRHVRDGGARKAVRINGDEHAALYWLLLDVLTDKFAVTIGQWVREEAAARGLPIAA
jgi:hypothetical protein